MRPRIVPACMGPRCTILAFIAPTFSVLAWPVTAVMIGAAAPAYMPVNHQRIVPLPKAEVWSRLHDFLQDQNFPVLTQDAAAGTLDAQRAVRGKGSFRGLADCPAKLLWRPEREVAELSVILSPSAEGTRVVANASFVQTAHPKAKGLLSLACTSTGVLEAAVLDVASGQPMQSAVVPH